MHRSPRRLFCTRFVVMNDVRIKKKLKYAPMSYVSRNQTKSIPLFYIFRTTFATFFIISILSQHISTLCYVSSSPVQSSAHDKNALTQQMVIFQSLNHSGRRPDRSPCTAYGRLLHVVNLLAKNLESLDQARAEHNSQTNM